MEKLKDEKEIELEVYPIIILENKILPVEKNKLYVKIEGLEV